MWWFAGGLPALPSHPCAHISKSWNLISCAMHVVELSYVSRHLFLTHLLSATFTLYYLCTHFTHTHTIVFLCMGISDSDALLMNTKKKRQKSLQCNSRISTKSFSALKGVVSADGDSRRSSAVATHNQPSNLL
jgi:hypothetical protein